MPPCAGAIPREGCLRSSRVTDAHSAALRLQVVTHFFGEELFGETCDQVHGSNAVPLEYPFSTPLLEYPRSTPNPMTTPNVLQCRMPCCGAAQPLPRALLEDGTGFDRRVLAGYSRGTVRSF